MADSRNKSFTDPVLQAVQACFSSRIGPRETVVVGYSGGLDSTVLLHAASRLASKSDLQLSALHVHHGLSRNADAWATSCARVSESYGVPLTILRVNVPTRTGEGLEAAARRERHRALSKYGADRILLAHHADDQAETVLHNLLRGAGVRGAAAMPEALGRVLRPLIALTRDTLANYSRLHKLVWIEDESNVDLRFTRNFLRHEILPAIESRFPRASENLAAAAGRFAEADSLLDELAMVDLQGAPAAFPLPLKLFRDMPDARARNLLRVLLARQHVQPPESRRLREFVRQMQTAGNDRHPCLDLARYRLWCEKRQLFFECLD